MAKPPVLAKFFGYAICGALEGFRVLRGLFAQLHATYFSHPTLMQEHLLKAYEAIRQNHETKNSVAAVDS